MFVGLLSSIWQIILVFLVTYAALRYFKTYLRSCWLVLRLPGPVALPLIGHAHWAINSKRLIYAAFECPKQYGLLIKVWLSVFPIVAVIDPYHIQKILTNPKHVEKIKLYKMVQDLIGEGLISNDGARWKVHRRLMQPSFNISILKAFVDTFNKGGNLMVRKLNQQIGTGKTDIKISPLVNETVFSLLTESVFGVPMDSSAAVKNKTESPFRSCSFSMTHRLMRPWLLFPALFKMTRMAKVEVHHKSTLASFTRKAMEDRKKLHKKGTIIEEKCFLDDLLQLTVETPEAFTLEDCAAEASTLMLAGQDSVAAALGFALHCLANNQNEQDKAYLEQMEIFGTSKASATLDDLKKMSYLEMCIKEVLRLYPTVPVFGRTLGEDLQLAIFQKLHPLRSVLRYHDHPNERRAKKLKQIIDRKNILARALLGEWLVPRGCEIIISPFVTHRLEEYYPEPEKFMPERFEPSMVAQRPPFSYIPFSGGSRNCIGYKYAELEMKVILSAVLRSFKLEPVKDKENISVSYRVSLRANGGIWVKLSRRM